MRPWWMEPVRAEKWFHFVRKFLSGISNCSMKKIFCGDSLLVQDLIWGLERNLYIGVMPLFILWEQDGGQMSMFFVFNI